MRHRKLFTKVDNKVNPVLSDGVNRNKEEVHGKGK